LPSLARNTQWTLCVASVCVWKFSNGQSREKEAAGRWSPFPRREHRRAGNCRNSAIPAASIGEFNMVFIVYIPFGLEGFQIINQIVELDFVHVTAHAVQSFVL